MTTRHASRCTAVTQRQGYQGWSNYQTWATALWFSNEPYGDEETARIATSGMDLYDQAEAYKQLAQEFVYGFNGEGEEKLTTGLAGDLLTDALQQVDYREIAKSHPASDYA